MWAGLAIGTFQTYYVRILFESSDARRRAYAELPYRKVPGLRRLLTEADRRLPIGANVLFAMPEGTPAGAYEYAHRRSIYLLAGKNVLPLRRENLARADYIVCWRACSPPQGFQQLWRSEDGVLLRKTR